MPGGRGGGGGGFSRGKKNYKGQRRHFTDEDELKNQQEKDEREKNWRKQRGIESDEEEDEDAKRARNRDMPPSDSESEEDSSEEEEEKPKGVSHLIQIQNPNRTGAKSAKKIGELQEGGGATQLSRREREELEKQEAKRRYQALHAQGKTDEAQADLARLAIIRQKREDAAKKKEAEAKAREEAAAKKKAKS